MGPGDLRFGAHRDAQRQRFDRAQVGRDVVAHLAVGPQQRIDADQAVGGVALGDLGYRFVSLEDLADLRGNRLHRPDDAPALGHGRGALPRTATVG